MIRKADATDVTTYFQMRLLTGGDGTGLTITDFDLTYTRSGDDTSAKVDAVALAAADDPHTDNGMIEVDATSAQGLYRVDWPDAAFAAGVEEVVLTVKHADCFTESARVELVAYDPQDATSLGLSRIDAAISSRLATSGYTAPLSSAGTRAAVGLAAADLDGQLAAIAAFIDTEIAAIKTVTDLLPNGGALSDLATLEARLTAARAALLDNMDTAISTRATAVDMTTTLTDLTTLLARATETRLAELDEANIPTDVDALLARLTAAR
ncbi:MAG: hypothetical protein Q8Q14_14755, partial [Gemmatimonadales bacterium]|nr:hypothetical protein [Gemmatimonadales bacterium]